MIFFDEKDSDLLKFRIETNLSIKPLNLRLNYTWQGKEQLFISKNWKLSKTLLSITDSQIDQHFPAKWIIPPFFERFSKLKTWNDRVWKFFFRDWLLEFHQLRAILSILVENQRNSASSQNSCSFSFFIYYNFNWLDEKTCRDINQNSFCLLFRISASFLQQTCCGHLLRQWQFHLNTFFSEVLSP